MQDTEQLIRHDLEIEKLAEGIDALTAISAKTNDKLDSISSALHQQELILERVNTAELRNKDSFNRIHKRVDDVENLQNGEGCTPLRVLTEKTLGYEKRLEELEKSKKWLSNITIGFVVIGTLNLLVQTVVTK